MSIFRCKDEANSFHPMGDKKKAHLTSLDFFELAKLVLQKSALQLYLFLIVKICDILWAGTYFRITKTT